MSKQGMGKVMLVLGALLMIAGGVLLALHHRVLATCFLDVVVETIAPKGEPSIPSYDYSWGTMVFGQMNGDFNKAIFGFLVVGIAQCLLLPLALGGAAKGIEKSAGRLSRVMLVLAGLVSLLSASALALMGSFTSQTFRSMSSSGAVDPVSLGEWMPIRASHFFLAFLVVVQGLILLAAWSGAMRAQSPRWMKSLPCLIPLMLFTLAMILIKFGPVDTMNRLLADVATAQPVLLARQFSLIVNGYYLGALLLAASAVAIIVMAMVGARPKDVVGG